MPSLPLPKRPERKPRRAFYGSRNAYRGALRDWANYWKRWRQARKRGEI